MAADKDDDDGGSYVSIGRAFPVPEPDDRRKTPYKVENDIAVDEKGRRRFHGAFTGGFSAGYFNTVGTKEGWTPSTFVSSRQHRADAQKQARDDFMDDEDRGEFGIAPSSVKTVSDYRDSSKEVETTKKKIYGAVSKDELPSAIPGGVPLDDLIMASKLSVGVKMLRSMGWKEGQGIGEKEIRGTTKKQGQNIYQRNSNQEDSEDIDIYLLGKLLAPKDVQPIDFTLKANLHGLGYKGLNPTTALFMGAADDKNESFKPSGKEKRGIRGTAFGVGAFEENDDDVYSIDDMSNYDITMTKERDDQYHGWTGPPKKQVEQGTLLGFSKSTSKSKLRAKSYPPPRLPRFFDPMRFYSVKDAAGKVSESRQSHSDLAMHALTAKERSAAIGENREHATPSWSVISKTEQGRSTTTTYVKRHREYEDEPTLADAVAKAKQNLKQSRFDQKPEPVDKPEIVSIAVLPAPPMDSRETFQPFKANPAKQERYKAYLQQKHLGEDVQLAFDSSMTEWEKERELDEFSRAAALYRPMSSTMASRFTRASFAPASADDDGLKRGDPSDEGEKSHNAAAMNMYGPLTRTTLEWRPDRLLCKRFNVPNPYPDSTFTGIPGRQKIHIPGFSLLSNLQMKKRDKEEQRRDSRRTEREKEKTDETSVSGKNGTTMKRDQPGPLAHLNDDVPIRNEEENVEKGSDHETPDDLAENKEERPSIDLFKAIFEGTDDESSSSSSEDETSMKEKETIADDPNTSAQRTEAENDLQATPQKGGILSHLNKDSSDKIKNDRVESSTRQKSSEIITQESNVYGPSLPPDLTRQPEALSDSSRPPMFVSSAERQRRTADEQVKHHESKKKRSKDDRKRKKKKRDDSDGEERSARKKSRKKEKKKKKKRDRQSSDESDVDDDVLIERLKEAKKRQSSHRVTEKNRGHR